MQKRHQDEPVTIIQGDENTFRNHIVKILSDYAELRDENIIKLTTDENMREFKKAFTTPEAYNDFNYEFYELLGDSTANNCIVWYFQRRFFKDVENIKLSKGTMREVAIMSRLKQEGASTRTFGMFARNLGFLPYITMTNFEQDKKLIKILEDVFEAFIGCLVYLCDKTFRKHIGFSVAYNIIEKLFDKENIKLKEEDLYDPKSILNNDKTKFLNYGIDIIYETVDLMTNKSRFEDMSNRYTVRVIMIDKMGNYILTSSMYKGKDIKNTEKNAAKEFINLDKYKQIKAMYNIL